MASVEGSLAISGIALSEVRELSDLALDLAGPRTA